MFRSFYVEACVLSSHQHAYIVSNAQMYRVHDERFCADTKGIGSVVHIIIWMLRMCNKKKQQKLKKK